jgi:hypothetical protein
VAAAQQLGSLGESVRESWLHGADAGLARRSRDRRGGERAPPSVSGEKDHTVPWAIANASFKKESANEGVTEIVSIRDRGHALTIDNGWREVCDTALTFVQRFVQ